MEKNYWQLFLIAFVFFIFSPPVTKGQSLFSQDSAVLIDDWPITVPSNADAGKKFIDGQINPNYTLVGSKWNKRILTFFFQNSTPDLNVNDQRDAVREAFDLWAEQTGMAFIEVCNAANADITILWATGDHGDGVPFTNIVLAHGWWPPPGGNPYPGDIHFNDDKEWTNQTRTTAAQPIDLVSIAAHEIGHSLGLNHTQVAGSLMLSTYTGSQRYLGHDDIAGIRSLYGQPNQFISGDNLVCSSCPYSVNIPLPPGTTLTWSTSRPSGLSINSNGLATAVGSFYGEVDVIATLTNTCGFSTQLKKTVWVGRPDVYTIKYDNDIPTSTMNSVTPNVTHTAYLDLANAIKAQVSGYVSWNPSPLIGYEYGQFFSKYDFNLQSGQTIYFNPISATNPCGTNMRTLAFTAMSGFSYYPNAVVDILTIEFDNVEHLEALPEQIQLFSENSLSPIRNIFLKEVYHQKEFQSGNKIEVDMRDLPKGTYFLHMIRKNGKKINVEKHQLLKR